MKTSHLRLMTVGVTLALLVAYRYTRGGQSQYPQPTRNLQLTTAKTDFDLPLVPMNAWAQSASDELIFLSRFNEGKKHPWKLSKVSSTGQTTQFQLPALPELEEGVGQPMQDIAVDADGSMYVPVVWRYTKQNEGVGVVLLDSNGNLQRLIKLRERSEIRHVAVGRDHSLFVLGIDPAYFNHQTDKCFLVHQYSPDGSRITSFSPCPKISDLRQPGSRVPGTGFDQLMQETQRGSIWVKGDSVYHLLPYAKGVREFTLTGAMKNDVTLGIPPIGQSRDIVLQVFLRNDGTLLATWLHTEVTGLNTFSSGRYAALHELASGRPLSVGKPLSSENGIPFLQRDDGELLAVLPAERGYKLGHLALSLQ